MGVSQKPFRNVGYTVDGVKGLLKDGGSKRKEALKQAIESLGGTMEAFYYAFGETDVYLIADMPDHASSTAASLVVAASGAAHSKTTVLITPEEVDEATKKTASYLPPGH